MFLLIVLTDRPLLIVLTDRETEKEYDVASTEAARILMVTALSGKENVLGAFREQCDGYVVKPVTRPALLEAIAALGFSLPE